MKPTSGVGWLCASLAALALCGGCSDDSSGGFGGMDGGTGGSDLAMLRVAHFANEVPSPDNTIVNFDVVGQALFAGLEFRQVGAYGEFPPDRYFTTIRTPGPAGRALASLNITLEAGRAYSVISYRDSSAADDVSLLLVEETTAGLDFDRARLTIINGAEDSSLPSIDAIDANTMQLLADELSLGAQADPTDLPAGDLDVGFNITQSPPTIDVGPFRTELVSEQFHSVVVVDLDADDDAVDLAAYALDPDTIGVTTPLPPTDP